MFKAILLQQTDDKKTRAELVDQDDSALPDPARHEVTVDVAWSTLNFKDALAITGKGAVVRSWPLVPGIDLAGTVAESRHADWKAGDQVVVTGWGMGENFWGGLTQRQRVQAGWLLKIPAPFTPRSAMVIATAGFTAALCVMALQKHGLQPGDGEVLVTGAAGGVGSIAVALLGKLGYTVVASTGRPQEADYLKGLGAAEIIDRAELSGPARALGKERWAGGIDSVGSHTLANVLSMTRYGGAVAACGLAQGMDLPTSVAPFILRGVSLLGVDSVMAPKALRLEAWSRLARDLARQSLARITSTIPLEGVIEAGAAIIEGRIRGRVVVTIA